jgi:hypothetical protein
MELGTLTAYVWYVCLLNDCLRSTLLPPEQLDIHKQQVQQQGAGQHQVD